MVKRHLLSLTEDYVGDWDFVDGVREIFQNALDQETENPENKMFFEYDEENEKLRIGNKTSVLKISSLLLGSTTKSDNEGLIGQFGEGYKLAMLVLTREGHEVVVYNYGAREVWRPRFVNSRVYDQKVFAFFVDKKYVWQTVPHNDLIIEIKGVTKEQYEEIIESNLHLQDVGRKYDTDQGDILLEERFKGKIYVNGLFVCNYDQYEKGYNFNPSDLDLDRDRKLVNDFALQWLASGMWTYDNEEMLDDVINLVEKNAWDVAFINRNIKSYSSLNNINKNIGAKFIEKHGENAVPVSTQWEMDKINSGYKPIVVTAIEKESIEGSGMLQEYDVVYVKSIREQLEEWMENNRGSIEEGEVDKFYNIIDEIEV